MAAAVRPIRLRLRAFGLALAVLGFALHGSATSTHADQILYSGQIVQFDVMTTGTYTITANGAQGGPFPGETGGEGGEGAEVTGSVMLTQGTVLDIVVGGQGDIGGGEGHLGLAAGGGGGGSFVYLASSDTLPLLVAGGGGGAGSFEVGGGPGQSSTFGQDGISFGGGAGGTGGNGGGSGFGANSGNGGGGWKSPGGSFPGGGSGGGDLTTMFVGGGSGSGIGDGDGGFGGGGGGGVLGGGGGGGYSGGGGGGGFAGGGGGSFIASAFTDTSASTGGNTGNGLVTITLVAASVPEPSTFAMAATAILAGCALAARRHLVKSSA